jgi:hypothetical protein
MQMLGDSSHPSSMLLALSSDAPEAALSCRSGYGADPAREKLFTCNSASKRGSGAAVSGAAAEAAWKCNAGGPARCLSLCCVYGPYR